jgi:hypothetical protein
MDANHEAGPWHTWEAQATALVAPSAFGALPALWGARLEERTDDQDLSESCLRRRLSCEGFKESAGA